MQGCHEEAHSLSTDIEEVEGSQEEFIGSWDGFEEDLETMVLKSEANEEPEKGVISLFFRQTKVQPIIKLMKL